jgi:hypothetical protein
MKCKKCGCNSEYKPEYETYTEPEYEYKPCNWVNPMWMNCQNWPTQVYGQYQQAPECPKTYVEPMYDMTPMYYTGHMNKEYPLIMQQSVNIDFDMMQYYMWMYQNMMMQFMNQMPQQPAPMPMPMPIPQQMPAPMPMPMPMPMPAPMPMPMQMPMEQFLPEEIPFPIPQPIVQPTKLKG